MFMGLSMRQHPDARQGFKVTDETNPFKNDHFEHDLASKNPFMGYHAAHSQDGCGWLNPGLNAMPTLRVNGQEHRVDCDRSTPLLYALRNDLGLTGARFGCGLGQCGACHVLIDGRSMASCEVTVDDCAAHHIETIEDPVDADGVLSALQRAFEDEQAGQCGYCLGGI